MQAKTSASTKPGYSWRISLVVIPLAKKSKIKETHMRCPRIQGLPKQTCGLMAIRDSNSPLFIGMSLFNCQKVDVGCVLRTIIIRRNYPRNTPQRRRHPNLPGRTPGPQNGGWLNKPNPSEFSHIHVLPGSNGDNLNGVDNPIHRG